MFGTIILDLSSKKSNGDLMHLFVLVRDDMLSEVGTNGTIQKKCVWYNYTWSIFVTCSIFQRAVKPQQAQ